MYKKNMSLLLIFLCQNESDVEKFNKESRNLPYHRMFVMSNKFLKDFIDSQKNDSFIVLDYSKQNLNQIIRFVSLYSNPQYSELLLFLNQNVEIKKTIEIIQKHNKVESTNYIFVTRFDLALNGFNIDNIEKQTDPLTFYEDISSALRGEIVNNKVFIEALREILPESKYIIDENINLDNEIRILINSKNKNSRSEYYVTDKIISDSVKNTILFTESDMNKYKYVIKRIDGLNCYIL